MIKNKNLVSIQIRNNIPEDGIKSTINPSQVKQSSLDELSLSKYKQNEKGKKQQISPNKKKKIKL